MAYNAADTSNLRFKMSSRGEALIVRPYLATVELDSIPIVPNVFNDGVRERSRCLMENTRVRYISLVHHVTSHDNSLLGCEYPGCNAWVWPQCRGWLIWGNGASGAIRGKPKLRIRCSPDSPMHLPGRLALSTHSESPSDIIRSYRPFSEAQSACENRRLRTSGRLPLSLT
jgi:hypothetical protein